MHGRFPIGSATPSIRPAAGVIVSSGLAVAVVGFACLGLTSGCGHDPAEREYLAALQGEETGMTREQQIAHIDQAILIAPTRAYYYETRAIFWIDLKKFDRALADLNRDIILLDRPYARFLRGLVLCQSGQIARSLADF